MTKPVEKKNYENKNLSQNPKLIQSCNLSELESVEGTWGKKSPPVFVYGIILGLVPLLGLSQLTALSGSISKLLINRNYNILTPRICAFKERTF